MDRHDRRHLPGYAEMLARGFHHNSVSELDHIDAMDNKLNLCNTPIHQQVDPSKVTAKENMKCELKRLKSFSTWPSHYPVKPADLAAAGFFYKGSDDEVECFCCQGRVLCWDEGDVPLEEHQKHFPTCPFLRNPATSGNVTLVQSHAADPEAAAAIAMSMPYMNDNITTIL